MLKKDSYSIERIKTKRLQGDGRSRWKIYLEIIKSHERIYLQKYLSMISFTNHKGRTILSHTLLQISVLKFNTLEWPYFHLKRIIVIVYLSVCLCVFVFVFLHRSGYIGKLCIMRHTHPTGMHIIPAVCKIDATWSTMHTTTFH